MRATLTLTNNTGTSVPAGYSVDVAQPTSFNHAQLVTALRSKSNGYDIRVLDNDGTVAGLSSISSVNTSSCRLIFNLTKALAASGGSTVYTVEFTDLSRLINPATATAGATVTSRGVTLTAAWSIPSVTLPVPGYPYSFTRMDMVDEISYPESPTTRRAVRNTNPSTAIQAAWYAIAPEEFYEIRAFNHAYGGGSGTFTEAAVSWLDAGRYRIQPNSLRLLQEARLSYKANATILKVPL
jgi:hypothetical protein